MKLNRKPRSAVRSAIDKYLSQPSLTNTQRGIASTLRRRVMQYYVPDYLRNEYRAILRTLPLDDLLDTELVLTVTKPGG